MFTGIIQGIGRINSVEAADTIQRLDVDAGALGNPLRLGDSVAVNGVCLTVATLTDVGFCADVSPETLARTTLGELSAGDAVNLEAALTPATPLGGHLVTGHVDDVGTVDEHATEGEAVRLQITAPDPLARYIAVKGSICVDGVSLTVNEVNGAQFGLTLVPHTLQVTTFGELREGSRVNLEVDIIARYLERLLLGDRAAAKTAPSRPPTKHS
ncbi:MAG: riboflavin synthase [Gammaproteobacteria bacterium]|nr:MAG: riboflavin synthase [Gammaproteobacteria bacterium]